MPPPFPNVPLRLCDALCRSPSLPELAVALPLRFRHTPPPDLHLQQASCYKGTRKRNASDLKCFCSIACKIQALRSYFSTPQIPCFIYFPSISVVVEALQGGWCCR